MRFSILLIITLFIYSIKTHDFWKRPYSVKDIKQNLVFMLIIDVGIIIVFLFNNYCSHADDEILDLYNNKLIKAFEKGQVFLIDQPSEGLLNLNNPYDLSERNENIERDKDYIWDAALYNGHYYIYFGALPAIAIMLPFHIITGKFLATATLTLAFSLLTVLVLAIIVKEIFKKYFPNLEFKYLILSTLIIMFGTMIIWINISPRFYELVTVAGLFFAALGFLLVLISKNDEIISYKKLFLGCLSMALAVACRPTNVFSSIIIVPFLSSILKNNIKNKKTILKIIFCVAIPYLSVAGVLMWYNYIRFGNVLEFGAKYQLTVNDMLHLKKSAFSISTGIICDLFNIPMFLPVFPFVQTNSNIIETFNYYYVEDIPGGVFLLAPICFFCFGIIKFLKKCDNKELKRLVISLLVSGITLVIFVSLQAGSTGRYFLDFAWMFVLAGIIIFMNIIQNLKFSESIIILNKVFAIILCYTLLINILLGFCQIGGNSMKNISPKNYINIENSIVFWK